MQLVHFENTPKAFANFSPGLERSDNPGGYVYNARPTLKGFANCRTLSGFHCLFVAIPGFSLRFEPWAEISERLRRKLKPVPVFLHLAMGACRAIILSFR